MSRRTASLPVLLAFLCTSVGALDPPVPVSPGRSERIVTIADGCPTFSWGASAGARRYELAVVREGDPRAEAREGLRVEIVGSSSSWTPDLAHCLEAGRRYGWSIRAVSETGVSDWSEPSLFEVEAAGGPTARGEVAEALELLLDHLDRSEDPAVALRELLETAGSTAGAAPAAASAAAGTGSGAASGTPTAPAAPEPQDAFSAPAAMDVIQNVSGEQVALRGVAIGSGSGAKFGVAAKGSVGALAVGTLVGLDARVATTVGNPLGTAGAELATGSGVTSGFSGVVGRTSQAEGYGGFFFNLDAGGMALGAGANAATVEEPPFRVESGGTVHTPGVALGLAACGASTISSRSGCNDHDILLESNGDLTVRLNKDLAGPGSNEFTVKDGNGNIRLRVFEDGTTQIFGSLEISDVAAVRGLTGTRAMDFGSVAAGSCSGTVFFSVSGAGTGDRAVLIPPETLPSGLFLVPIEISGGGIRARMCNLTGSAVDPPSLSVQYVLLR